MPDTMGEKSRETVRAAGDLAEETAAELVDDVKEILNVLDGKSSDPENDDEESVEVETTTTIRKKA